MGYGLHPLSGFSFPNAEPEAPCEVSASQYLWPTASFHNLSSSMLTEVWRAQ